MAVPDTDPDVNVGFNVFAPIKLQPAGALISVQLKEVAFEVIPDKVNREPGHNVSVEGIPITAAEVVPSV
jgi:hypothetical protein